VLSDRLRAGADVQRCLGAGEPSPGRGLQASPGGELRHLPKPEQEAEAVTPQNGHQGGTNAGWCGGSTLAVTREFLILLRQCSLSLPPGAGGAEGLQPPRLIKPPGGGITAVPWWSQELPKDPAAPAGSKGPTEEPTPGPAPCGTMLWGGSSERVPCPAAGRTGAVPPATAAVERSTRDNPGPEVSLPATHRVSLQAGGSGQRKAA